MSDLTDFLLARIAEDEAVARAAIDPRHPGTHWQWVRANDDVVVVEPTWEDMPISLRTAEEFQSGSAGPLPAFALDHVEVDQSRSLTHIARHDPARILAECAAKRAIIAEHPIEMDAVAPGCRTCDSTPDDGVWGDGPCATLRILASPYADHPDFREEWRA